LSDRGGPLIVLLLVLVVMGLLLIVLDGLRDV
jgi:Tfp pilus assembly protein PilX